jgi:hypothetical protein
MLSGRWSPTTVGASLLTIFLVGIALVGARAIVLLALRHVEVGLSNVDGTEQAFVECVQAVSATSGDTEKKDLGWMPADTLVFLSATSRDYRPAWGFEVSSNGRTFFEKTRGHAGVLGFPAEKDAVVAAKAVTAGGDPNVGPIGCQEPGLVDRAVIPEYVKSPAEGTVAAATGDESPYRPRHFPYDQIDALGRWALPLLAGLGAIAAVGTPSIRRTAWSHGWGLATGSLAVLGAGVFGVDALPTIVVLGGALLLLVVSLLLLFASEGAAGAGGAQG